MNSKRPKILIVDDESGIRDLLVEILSDEGYATLTAENAEAAWAVRSREKLSLILLDIWMPGKDGLTLLKQWVDCGLSGVPIVVMSGHATINTAVEAIKLGAHEVLEKPIATNRLLMVIEKILRNSKDNEPGNPNIRAANFGQSNAMTKFKQQLLDASADGKPVLLIGEPNAGASFYGQMLTPPQRPMVIIERNNELEGKTDDLLRRAIGGTVMVRSLDILSPIQQNGLLALLHESGRANVQVVACTSVAPEILQKEQDYNQNVLSAFSEHTIRQPLLSECMDDIASIADLIVHQLSENAMLPHKRLSPQAAQILTNRSYRNDFIELFSLLRTAMMHTASDIIDVATINIVIGQFERNSIAEVHDDDMFALPLREARAMFEDRYFRRLMETTRGNIPQAVKISGLERTYLYRKIKQYN